MTDLEKAFQDPARSGVYRVASSEDLEAAGQAAGLAVARIPLGSATSKESLLRAVSAALEFPDWFGENWDALEDCLTDLSWRPAEAHLLVFERPERLPRDVMDVFLDVLESAARKWAAEDARFFAVFADPGQGLSLPELGR